MLLRHAQHQIHDDVAARLDIARNMVAGKIRNSRWILLRAERDAEPAARLRIRTHADELAAALITTRDAESLDIAMGIEGNAARTYFTALTYALRPSESIPPFTHRNRRPPTDPVNALLSFTYGPLRSLVHGAAEQVGLDPHIGYLHGLRPGKPALALDLMEEFRPVLADRFRLTLLNRRQIRGEHFEVLSGGAVRLTDDGRTTVLGVESPTLGTPHRRPGCPRRSSPRSPGPRPCPPPPRRPTRLPPLDGRVMDLLLTYDVDTTAPEGRRRLRRVATSGATEDRNSATATCAGERPVVAVALRGDRGWQRLVGLVTRAGRCGGGRSPDGRGSQRDTQGAAQTARGMRRSPSGRPRTVTPGGRCSGPPTTRWRSPSGATEDRNFIAHQDR
ncbi:CRISPR-associated endonuclease Cas1 [Streptomyces sp. NBC_01335]|uniref:CRISPR-associated endonuclease Cas1 n=1 Tax=Streptomyces sp. NBC_01335 TaxID=2903828 RepID=UPI003FA38BC8